MLRGKKVFRITPSLLTGLLTTGNVIKVRVDAGLPVDAQIEAVRVLSSFEPESPSGEYVRKMGDVEVMVSSEEYPPVLFGDEPVGEILLSKVE